MKKNKRMIVIVFVLLLSISVTFAYFVGRTVFEGKGASTKVTTANLKGATLKIEGELTFNSDNIYPGHKEISIVKVTATGNNELIPYNLIWNGTNGLNTTLKYQVYKTSKKVNASSSCNKTKKVEDGAQIYYEECDISNISDLKDPINNGEIPTSENESITLVEDAFIDASPTGTEIYYYIVIEYPDEGEQNEDIGKEFRGELKATESDVQADINILAVYVEDEEGNYNQQKEIPQYGNYKLNGQSFCNNSATPSWDYKTKRLSIDSLTKSGTSCYLYFEKNNGPTNLKELLIKYDKEKAPSGYTTADIEESEGKIYTTQDNDGTSYFFRGNVQDNYVNFANLYWRIIRINGDGTLRLIYQGDLATANGQIGTSAYNLIRSDNTYVGYYTGSTGGNNFDNTHSSSTAGTIAEVLNKWYQDNVKKNYDKYVDKNVGFCNDRKIATTKHNGYMGTGIGLSTTAYKAEDRLYDESMKWLKTQMPTLMCGNSKESVEFKRDYLTPKNANKGKAVLNEPIGLITIDEVVFAGGFGGENNSSFYLYTDQNYWTMTPGDAQPANIFMVRASGSPERGSSDYVIGVRPVINLRADIEFEEGGEGTAEHPYVVKTKVE